MRRFGAELLVAVVTFAVYARSLWSDFTLDDGALIIPNVTIHSWRFLPKYFTEHLWQNVQPQTAYYRPLVLLWFRLNDAAFGLQPACWHLTSILAHIVASVLVLRLALRLTRDRRIALIAGFLFALHPVHVETVAWVSDVVDALCTAWMVAAMLCFIRSREGSQRWLAASLFCFCGALLTKEPGVTLPVLAFLYVVLFEDRSPRIVNGLRAVAWYVPIAILYFVVRHFTLHGFTQRLQDISAATLVLSIPNILWTYARLLLVPVGLSPFYDIYLAHSAGLREVWLPTIALLALLALFVVIVRRLDGMRPAALFAMAWIVITVAPVLNLQAFTPGQMVHDRYIYLASVGFAVIAGIVLAQVRLGSVARMPLLASAALVLFAVLTFAQQAYWRNNDAMFSRSVEIAPHNDDAESGLATMVAKRGNYPLAISLYSDILKRNPKHWIANTNLGWTYFLIGNYEQAEKYLTAAAVLNVDRADAFFDLGSLYQKTGRLDLALAAFQHAQKVSPPHPLFHEKMSEVLEAQGDLPQALSEAEIAAQLAPGNVAMRERYEGLRARVPAR